MSFLLAFWFAKLCFIYELCLQTEGVKLHGWKSDICQLDVGRGRFCCALRPLVSFFDQP